MALLEATFLKQRSAQKKTTKPSEVTGNRQKVEPTVGDEHFDPTTAVDDEDEDAAIAGPSRASPSLRSMLERVLETQSSHYTMMETFMTTQAACGQLLDSLIIDVAALRVEFIEYRSSFLPHPPSDD
nr:hypothetical protein CFP56_68053 [Quercus suber]